MAYLPHMFGMTEKTITVVNHEDGSEVVSLGDKELIRSENDSEIYWKDVVTRLGFVVESVYVFESDEEANT